MAFIAGLAASVGGICWNGQGEIAIPTSGTRVGTWPRKFRRGSRSCPGELASDCRLEAVQAVAGGGAGADERMRAVVIRAFGGPEVLTVERVPRPAIGFGHTLIKVARAGVNFFDTERRAAGWTAAHLPEILGTEVAGARVSDGRRVVGLTDGGVGGYAEYAKVADEFAVPSRTTCRTRRHSVS